MDNLDLLDEVPETTRDDSERRIFSFIVKVLLDPHPRHPRKLRWRGKLTFVPDGEVRAVASLGALLLVLYQRLEQRGVWFHSLCRALFRLYQFFARSGC